MTETGPHTKQTNKQTKQKTETGPYIIITKMPVIQQKEALHMTEKRLPHDKNGQRHKQANLMTGTETATKKQKQTHFMTGTETATKKGLKRANHRNRNSNKTAQTGQSQEQKQQQNGSNGPITGTETATKQHKQAHLTTESATKQ